MDNSNKEINFGKPQNFDILKALQFLKPDIKVVVWENKRVVYDDNETFRPTIDEILAVDIEKAEKHYNLQHYQELRSAEYPDFKDYLDGIVKGDQEQIKKYITDCLSVKAKYPKPSE